MRVPDEREGLGARGEVVVFGKLAFEDVQNETDDYEYDGYGHW
jgi:hypothetical protein